MVEHPESRAAVHGALVAAHLEEAYGAHRITLHPGALLIRNAEACTAVAHATFAGLIEQLGGSAIVAKDVSPLL
jgi:hypothetical protein